MDRNINISIYQLKAWGESIALSVCEQFGVNKMGTYRQGVVTYGQFFKDNVANGKLQPIRKGRGDNGKREYSVRDILSLIAAEKEKAQLATHD